MVLTLDPRYPVVWRSPFSVQLGVDTVAAIVDEVSSAEERMISALVTGVSRDGLEMIAESAGGSRAEVDRLLDALGDAVVVSDPVDDADRPAAGPALAPVIELAGNGPVAERLAAALRENDLIVAPAAREGDAASLGIVVADYVVAPDFYGLWLRRDMPHFAMTLSGTGVHLGPVVEPGSGPCLFCVHRHRADADRAWPAIAAQLLGRAAPGIAPIARIEAVAAAARLAVRRLTGGPLPATSLWIDAESGRQRELSWSPHPGCGCVALPGNATADARPHAALPWPPTRDAAAPGPA